MQEPSSDFITTASFEQNSLPRECIYTSEKGYSELYRIDRLGRFRVLKCLKPEFRGQVIYEDMLRKDFEIGYSLRHPGIVEYYGFIQDEQLGNCIEMEWVDGRSLAEILKDGPVDNALADSILDQLCDALSYLHSRQVVHRDLKRSNVLVTHEGNSVRLIDFGFSDSAAHSILKAPAGTMQFSAPEVLNDGKADVRSDIYSLGLLMSAITRKHRAVARKCCNRNPARRYKSVRQVQKDLHSHSKVWAGVLFIALIALMAVWPYLDRDAEKPAEEAAVPVVDTLRIVPEPLQSAEPTKPAPTLVPVQAGSKSAPGAAPAASPTKPASSKVSVDTTVFDNLFRQATDLFE